MNGQFQIAVHILTLLEYAQGELISSEYIAGSININPVLVRKEIGNLRTHGLINSKEGKTGGYTLGKSANKLTFSDIYKAVKNQAVLGQAKNKPNPDCPIGRNIGQHLDNLDNDVDITINQKLSTITLADFCKKFQ